MVVVGKWLVRYDPRRAPPVVDLAVAVASAAPAEPSVLLVCALESILNLTLLLLSASESILHLTLLLDSLQPVWSVL